MNVRYIHTSSRSASQIKILFNIEHLVIGNLLSNLLREFSARGRGVGRENAITTFSHVHDQQTLTVNNKTNRHTSLMLHSRVVLSLSYIGTQIM